MTGVIEKLERVANDPAATAAERETYRRKAAELRQRQQPASPHRQQFAAHVPPGCRRPIGNWAEVKTATGVTCFVISATESTVIFL